MDIRVKFLGGAGSVTGSKFLLMIDDLNLLIDCGLFQGQKELRLRNWSELPVEPSTIHAIILTHAHIDHSGYIPLIIKEGFEGVVHCTEPTHQLAKILLLDSAKLQEEEAAFANKKGYSKHQPAKPLYEVRDAERALKYFASHPLNTFVRITDQIELRFLHAGHILGAASVEVRVHSAQGTKTMVFSGDIGPQSSPLHLAPKAPETADILFIESTYGGRTHENLEAEQILAGMIRDCEDKGGCLIIPAFSLGRTQLILYYLWKIFQNRKSLPVFVDSPMAISVTELYRRFTEYHRLSSEQNYGHQIFDAPFIHYVTEQSRSKYLNTLRERAIIISASGMATGGRILHHLFHRLPNEHDTILFTGFLPEGTRGRRLVDGEPTVKIFGEEVPVKANIQLLDGLSAHADQNELLKWTDSIHGRPKMTFIVHGEADQSLALKKELEKKDWNVTIPDYLESHTLFDHL